MVRPLLNPGIHEVGTRLTWPQQIARGPTDGPCRRACAATVSAASEDTQNPYKFNFLDCTCLSHSGFQNVHAYTHDRPMSFRNADGTF